MNLFCTWSLILLTLEQSGKSELNTFSPRKKIGSDTRNTMVKSKSSDFVYSKRDVTNLLELDMLFLTIDKLKIKLMRQITNKKLSSLISATNANLLLIRKVKLTKMTPRSLTLKLILPLYYK